MSLTVLKNQNKSLLKKLYTMCIIMLMVFTIQAQTGNGVVAQINSPYSFTPTTVDSTTTIDIVFVNTVAAPQTVTLAGISAPFNISSSSVLIGASDSTTLQLSFNPTSTGNFTNTLSWTGSIFGSGSLVLDGEGVQVALSVSSDTINMGNLSLGTSVTETIILSNTGTGTMNISTISTNNSQITVTPTFLQITQ